MPIIKAIDPVLFIFMIRDFSKWHYLKQNIDNKYSEKLFREREIWWCSLGVNVGFEQDGKHAYFERPILVLRKFNKGMFWGLPLTSRPKQGFYYFSFSWKDATATVLLSQLRVLSSKRLIRRVGKINHRTFSDIRYKVIELLKIKNEPILEGSRVPDGN